ncbi:peptidylprolyl isomerase [Schaalia sp. ZJ1691]|uniref:FKBP-type peptidyl-prolyl cis-trans isomerase n=1 Tax=Schaalia sp. ZJ1691 TaxID=2709404 RepID=UPI0013EBC555|nr:peptidylprolyl isomerase [Schaalia sp. ZJ1691]
MTDQSEQPMAGGAHVPRRAQVKSTRHMPRWVLALIICVVVAVIGVGVYTGSILITGQTKPSANESGDVTDGRSAGATQHIVSAIDSVSVSGRVGATPVVDLLHQVSVSSLKSRVLFAGEGREITKGSPMLLAVTTFDAQTGENLSAQGRPQLQVATAGDHTVDEALESLIIGKTEGSRILAIHPVSEDTSSDVSSTQPVRRTEINVIDVLPSIATGSPVEAVANPVLTVSMTPDGPAITHGQTPPSSLKVETLLQGDGAQIRQNDRVIAQYTVVGWSDSIARSSTWDTGMPRILQLSHVMKGLSEALVDQRVGSRLALTIPADLASGDDVLCVVIDILGAEPQSTSDSQKSSTDSSQSSR